MKILKKIIKYFTLIFTTKISFRKSLFKKVEKIFDSKKIRIKKIFFNSYNVVCKIEYENEIFYGKLVNTISNGKKWLKYQINIFKFLIYEENKYDIYIYMKFINELNKIFFQKKIYKKISFLLEKNMNKQNDDLTFYCLGLTEMKILDDISYELSNNLFCFLYKQYRANRYRSFFNIFGAENRRYNYNKATFLISKLIGIEEVSNDVFLGVINLLNEKILFMFSKEIDGGNPKELSIKLNNNILKGLSTLEILDYLTTQKDHWIHNLWFNKKKNQIVCFDNDYERTFSLKIYERKTKEYDFSKIIKNNIFNRTGIEEKLYKKIITTKFYDLKKYLKADLTIFQILSVWLRLTRLKHALINSVQDNSIKLLKPNEFTKNLFTNELIGKYGITYISNYNNCIQ